MTNECKASDLVKAAENVGQHKAGQTEAASKLLSQFVGMKPEEAFKLMHEMSDCSGHKLAGGGGGSKGRQGEDLQYVGQKGTLHVPALSVEYANGNQTVTVGDPKHPLAQKTTHLE
jgi:hypothetical protein